METTKPSSDLFNQHQEPRLTGMLNVLTILTFIGCALAYLGGIYGFLTSETQVRDLEKLRDQSSGSEFVDKMAQGSLEIAQKSYEYRYVMLASCLIFTTMCLIGALQMRKLKKSGFTIYTIGELAPIVLTAVLIGFSFFGSIMIFMSAIFAVLFVILYATQLKYMVK